MDIYGLRSNQTTISKGRYSSADTSLDNAGAVQVFSRVGTSWTQEAYIKPSNIDQYDRFGAQSDVEFSATGGMLI